MIDFAEKKIKEWNQNGGHFTTRAYPQSGMLCTSCIEGATIASFL